MLNITKLSLISLFLVACGGDSITSRPNVDPTRDDADSDFVTSGNEMDSSESGSDSSSESSGSSSETETGEMTSEEVCKEYGGNDEDNSGGPESPKFTLCGKPCKYITNGSKDCGEVDGIWQGLCVAPENADSNSVCVIPCDDPNWNGPPSPDDWGDCESDKTCIAFMGLGFVCAEIPED